MIKMNKELEGFLHDLVVLIQEKYDESLQESDEESESDKGYRLGSSFAYFDILDLIRSELIAFGYDSKLIGEITKVISAKQRR